jgi:NAD(P)-dependent dehydrogenase (short-subunit alcohol dehydrogenase family)
MLLDNKVSLVTGGAGGIGREIALALAKEGSQVAIVDIKQKEGEEIVKQLNQFSKGYFIHSDISKVAHIEQVVQEVYDKFGALDILINNAGISIRTAVDEMTEEEWDRILTINLKSAYFFSKEAARLMKARRSGVIINVSSIRAIIADKTHAGYAITKAGMIALTKSLAVSLAEFGIRANAVMPGYVLTPMTEHNLSNRQWLEWLREKVPMGRLIDMQEVADAVVFLASQKASGITGESIVIDGGWLANGC